MTDDGTSGYPPGRSTGPGGGRTEPFPIAVVGIGCRFPGAHGPQEFWRLLHEGRDVIAQIPPERFDAAAYRAALDADGGPLLSSAAGGFLDRIDGFDAEFFGISPYEAARMDPQHRLFLETAWEAVEDAGLPPEQLAGSRTGVYVAQLTAHYWEELYRAGVWDMHAMLGAELRGSLPARLSHLLDLRGPAVTVDASCASALLAVHLACQGLRLGELDAAVVGGTNLVTVPEDGVVLSRGGLLSPGGRCRFGDADADGFVRSEGVAAVVLKPLERALADGDRVYSVILGGAASNDGASNGLFITPSEPGQREMLRAAYAAAGVAPSEVDYVEAHGAGTQVGDRTELSALGAVLGAGRGGRGRLVVGSVKSNLGHTESASGLAGLIKVALALWHGEIPATLHVRRPNPAVDWRGGGLRLARRRTPWPRSGRRALAGVNSFGISGANVHLVLSGPPRSRARRAAEAEPEASQKAYILPLSARSGPALAELERGYLSLLESPEAARLLPDLCHTAAVRRGHHRFRRAVVGDGPRSLAAGLRAELSAHGTSEPALTAPRVVYVFPGLGAQWTGMARDLYAQCPPFARALDEYDAAVRAEAGWSVLDLLASEDPLTDVGLAQPAVWAVECALAAVWEHWGVRADLAIGHSMGEVSAATVSGALSAAGAAAVMCRRSDLMRRVAAGGAMSAVRLSFDAASELVSGYHGKAVVAVSNGPNSSVLAGQAPALDAIERDLERDGVYCRRVNAHVAAHGPAMDPVLDDLRELLRGLRPAEGRFPVQSTVHGGRTLGADMDAEYWVDNLRERVRFCEAVQAVLAEGRPVLFVEMSPHPLLAHSLQECVDHAGATAAIVSSLRRSEPGLAGLLDALGQAYAHGAQPDWSAVSGNWNGAFLAPPPYPWQRRSFGVADAAPNVPARLVAGAGAAGLAYERVGFRPDGTPAAEPPSPPLSAADAPVCDLAATRAWYGERLSGAVFAERFGRPAGDGPPGPRVLQAWRRPGEALALLELPPGVTEPFDPALWSLCRDLVRAAIPGTHALSLGPLELAGADRIRVLRPLAGPLWTAVRLEYGRAGRLRGTLRAAGRDRLLVFEACGLDLAAASVAASRPAVPRQRSGPSQAREPDARPSASRPVGVLSAADIHTGLLEQTARVLGLSPEQIDPDQPMTALGLDSLLAMDLRRRLQRRLGVSIGPGAVLGGGTLRELALLAHSLEAGRA